MVKKAKSILGCTRKTTASTWKKVILPLHSAHLECWIQFWAHRTRKMWTYWSEFRARQQRLLKDWSIFCIKERPTPFKMFARLYLYGIAYSIINIISSILTCICKPAPLYYSCHITSYYSALTVYPSTLFIFVQFCASLQHGTMSMLCLLRFCLNTMHRCDA